MWLPVRKISRLSDDENESECAFIATIIAIINFVITL